MKKLITCVTFAILIGSGPAWAGAWTFPRGTLWSKLTVMIQDTGESYIGVPRLSIPRGQREPNLLNGEYSSRTFFFDAFYGITDHFNIGVQVPFFNQTFEDDELTTLFGGPVSSTGFSDIRVFLKHKVTNRPFVSSLKFGVKAPTGEFENTQGLIPVGEGQWDFDFIVQVGRSFWPFRGYANADVGYRLRMKNDEIERDPGDELFWIAEFGYRWTDKLLAVIKWEGVDGAETTSLGLQLSGDVKKIQYISPAVLFRATETTTIEAGIRFSISGQNYPAGPVFQAGLNYKGNPFSR
jgi:hypothetical protein